MVPMRFVKCDAPPPIFILVSHVEEVLDLRVGYAHPLGAHEVGVFLEVQPPVFVLVRIAVLLIARNRSFSESERAQCLLD